MEPPPWLSARITYLSGWKHCQQGRSTRLLWEKHCKDTRLGWTSLFLAGRNDHLGFYFSQVCRTDGDVSWGQGGSDCARSKKVVHKCTPSLWPTEQHSGLFSLLSFLPSGWPGQCGCLLASGGLWHKRRQHPRNCSGHLKPQNDRCSQRRQAEGWGVLPELHWGGWQLLSSEIAKVFFLGARLCPSWATPCIWRERGLGPPLPFSWTSCPRYPISKYQWCKRNKVVLYQISSFISWPPSQVCMPVDQVVVMGRDSAFGSPACLCPQPADQLSIHSNWHPSNWPHAGTDGQSML